MVLEWKWNNDDVFLDETLPSDTLDREKYALFLYQISAARGANSSLVVNINAEWGAGKTYFTKRFAKSISEAHPTVYIDAWKEDFSEDPLLTIFSAIKEQLTGQSDKFTTLLNNTIENIGPLLKTATPIIIEGLVNKITGIKNLTDITKSLSVQLLDMHTQKSKKISSIKNGISKWVSFIKQKDGINKELPLFIIIDELDRCRPSFAINLLEISKHIFNIPGVVFIIATDTEQLQHSIKVIYGENFSASQYLNRFFDRRFLLPSPKMNDLIRTHTLDVISNEFELKKDIFVPFINSYDDFLCNCTSVFEAFNINLRDTLKIYDRLMDQILILNEKFDAVLFLILSCIYTLDNNIYYRIKNNRDIKNIIEYNQEIKINYNLSESITKVKFFGKHGGGLASNKFSVQKITIPIKQYIIQTLSILDAQNIITHNHSAGEKNWKNGGLMEQMSYDSYFKIGWADCIENNLGISRHQYFELIELSTTLE